MKNFCEMPVVKVLLVALVVLFVWGLVVPEGALARVQMRDGHEGDPEDGFDFMGGGSGGGNDGASSKPENVSFKSLGLGFLIMEWVVLDDGNTMPVFLFHYRNQSSEILQDGFPSFGFLRREK